MRDHSSCSHCLLQDPVQHSPRLNHESYSAHRCPKTLIKWIRFNSCTVLKYKHSESKYEKMHSQTYTERSGFLWVFYHLPSIQWGIIHPFHVALILNIRQTDPNTLLNKWRYVPLCVKKKQEVWFLVLFFNITYVITSLAPAAAPDHKCMWGRFWVVS